MKIDFTNEYYNKMAPFVDRINDLYRGTIAVKDNPSKYLDIFATETPDDFNKRAAKAVFANYVDKTIDNTNSMLYKKQHKLDYKVKYKSFFNNVDGEGTRFWNFSSDHSQSAILNGLSFLWVDNPNFTGKELTRYDIQKNKLYPVFKNVNRSDLLDAKYAKNSNGSKVLTQVVIRQSALKAVDEFEDEEVEQFIVLRINSGAIFERADTKEGFVLINKWENKLGYIPIFTTYSDKTDFMKADIPFLDLGEMNIDLYNATSQDKSVRLKHSNPILSTFGLEEVIDEETGEPIPLDLGMQKGINFPEGTKGDSGLTYTSIDTSISTVNQSAIKVIKEDIETFAFNVLSKFSFNTATEARINDKKSSLFLIELSNSLEQTLINALACVEDYLDDDLGIELKLNKDFDILPLDPNTMDKIIQLKDNGYISLDTLWDKLGEGDWLTIDDREAELAKIKKEASFLEERL